MTPAACAPPVAEPFLTSTIHALDCSARQIGAFGYSGLGSTGGPATGIILAGMTIAIALFGLRLMFGERMTLSAPVGLTARIALVLLLALSWPAMRTLFFDVAFDAPAEIASALTGSVPGNDRIAFLNELQAMDDHVQALTAWGTGREELNAVRTASGQPAAQAFSSVAVSDHLAMGMARVTALTSAIVLTGGLRLAGGILFALAPLLAVFLLFRPTEGLVTGWARSMLAVTLSGAAGAVLLGLETRIALPLLAARIVERGQAIATPSAPTELLVLTLSISLMGLVTTLILFRVCFAHFPYSRVVVPAAAVAESELVSRSASPAVRREMIVEAPREVALAGSVSRLVTRESRTASDRLRARETGGARAVSIENLSAVTPARHRMRQSRAARMRSGQ